MQDTFLLADWMDSSVDQLYTPVPREGRTLASFNDIIYSPAANGGLVIIMVAERKTKLPQAGPSVNSAGQSRSGLPLVLWGGQRTAHQSDAIEQQIVTTTSRGAAVAGH
ncbi:hypothetical protein JYU34_012267 [Plutella xylostella]|uniref:Uncharacterized protein n=1 Tax=Plutella xylostella TaxID=51655 RepID=A0ABQ7QFZ8_PLUXY|nr:hypothetical protein JYU34_012267 [Plutella xylostella]